MTSNNLLQTMTKATQQLDEARDLLLKSSHDSMRAESDKEWQLAERLFTLARNADTLRRETLSLIEVLKGTKTAKDASDEVSKRAQKSLKKRKEDYPKYVVRGEQLIKTGLSRDMKSEYEHAVPRAEFEKILQRLVRLRTLQQDFKSEDAQEGLVLPVYQVYAVLSLLRHLNIIKQGRRGYYSFNSVNLPDPASIWNSVLSSGGNL